MEVAATVEVVVAEVTVEAMEAVVVDSARPLTTATVPESQVVTSLPALVLLTTVDPHPQSLPRLLVVGVKLLLVGQPVLHCNGEVELMFRTRQRKL